MLTPYYVGVYFSLFQHRHYVSKFDSIKRLIKHKNAGVLNSIAFSDTWRMVKVASVVDLFLLKPCCSSHSPVPKITSLKTFGSILDTALMSPIPR